MEMEIQRGFQQEVKKTTNFDRFGYKMIKRDRDRTQVQTINPVQNNNNKSIFVINASFSYKNILIFTGLIVLHLCSVSISFDHFIAKSVEVRGLFNLLLASLNFFLHSMSMRMLNERQR